MSVENDHPFRCNGCGNEFIQARFAARCCKSASTDLRDGAVYAFSEADEVQFIAADDVRWAAIHAEYHYECSCGESFKLIEHAKSCRKCRTYTEVGYCTEVTDRNTGKVVWSLQTEAAEISMADAMPLTDKAFARLLAGVA